MDGLHEWQQRDPSRFRRLGFRIHKKGAREASRVERFFSYAGVDEATKHVLRTYAQPWLEKPLTFWSRPQQGATMGSFMWSPAQLVSFYVNAKYDDA